MEKHQRKTMKYPSNILCIGNKEYPFTLKGIFAAVTSPFTEKYARSTAITYDIDDVKAALIDYKNDLYKRRPSGEDVYNRRPTREITMDDYNKAFQGINLPEKDITLEIIDREVSRLLNRLNYKGLLPEDGEEDVLNYSYSRVHSSTLHISLNIPKAIVNMYKTGETSKIKEKSKQFDNENLGGETIYKIGDEEERTGNKVKAGILKELENQKIISANCSQEKFAAALANIDVQEIMTVKDIREQMIDFIDRLYEENLLSEKTGKNFEEIGFLTTRSFYQNLIYNTILKLTPQEIDELSKKFDDIVANSSSHTAKPSDWTNG